MTGVDRNPYTVWATFFAGCSFGAVTWAGEIPWIWVVGTILWSAAAARWEWSR